MVTTESKLSGLTRGYSLGLEVVRPLTAGVFIPYSTNHSVVNTIWSNVILTQTLE